MADFDVVIRAGTIADGTGGSLRTGDIGIRDGLVVAVGDVDTSAHRTIDADGLLVAPGWVDIHTHYDGQATWDTQLTPSSWHGVTTVVMGNCGVGFAPVRKRDHNALVELMEGVEDIPGTALHEGLSWEWESFAQYLDEIEARPHDVDLAAQVPHGALRLYVMGDRGAAGAAATEDDIMLMGRIAREAIAAGAVGFTTSRTKNHKTSTGAYTPTLRAEAAELIGIASEIGRGNKGVLQVVSDFESPIDEMAMLRSMMSESGRPLSVSLAQNHRAADAWRRIVTVIEQCNSDGLEMRAQVAVRPIGILIGLQATINPLSESATYRAVAAEHVELSKRVEQLREPSVRAKVLSEVSPKTRTHWGRQASFVLGERPNYEPDPTTSIPAIAARNNVEPMELLYDEIARGDGTALIYVPIINFAHGNLDHVEEMLQHPWCIPGLSDGGAHVGTICDASFPTTLLQHWGRDRPLGTLPIELLVAQQTCNTARAMGFTDRGALLPGMRADINVIDMEALSVEPPTMAFDLPAGGKRLLQRARGYRHTLVRGVETYAEGEFTGALPGRLVRG